MTAGHLAYATERCAPAKGTKMHSGESSIWDMRIHFSPEQVPLNTPFQAIISICSQTETMPNKLAINAIMPAHKHGMNYKPTITRVDDRTYQINNLVFHMPGIWRLEVTAYTNATPHRFSHEMDLH